MVIASLQFKTLIISLIQTLYLYSQLIRRENNQSIENDVTNSKHKTKTENYIASSQIVVTILLKEKKQQIKLIEQTNKQMKKINNSY